MVQITIASKESDFEIYYKEPIPIGQNYEIGLLSSTLWYSWQNISETFDNNKFKLFYNGNWQTITLPDGNYHIDEMNHFLEDSFDGKPPIILDGNSATNRFILAINEAGAQVDFTEGSLHQLLGFEAKVYSDKLNFAALAGDITRGVERVLIRCNIISHSYQNNLASDILYSFSPMFRRTTKYRSRRRKQNIYRCGQ